VARLSNAMKSTRAAGYLPANQIKKIYGVSAFRLQRLAMGGVIRHETRPTVVSAYHVEDVEKWVAGNQAPAEQGPRAEASAK